MKLFDLTSVPDFDRVKPLSVRDLSGRCLVEAPATGVWTLDSLIARLGDGDVCEAVTEAYGADVYVGLSWVGSTEV
ncbi:TPA: hypothetical protein ACUNF5_007297 [Burkholderia orbicola]